MTSINFASAIVSGTVDQSLGSSCRLSPSTCPCHWGGRAPGRSGISPQSADAFANCRSARAGELVGGFTAPASGIALACLLLCPLTGALGTICLIRDLLRATMRAPSVKARLWLCHYCLCLLTTHWLSTVESRQRYGSLLRFIVIFSGISTADALTGTALCPDRLNKRCLHDVITLTSAPPAKADHDLAHSSGTQRTGYLLKRSINTCPCSYR